MGDPPSVDEVDEPGRRVRQISDPHRTDRHPGPFQLADDVTERAEQVDDNLDTWWRSTSSATWAATQSAPDRCSTTSTATTNSDSDPAATTVADV